MNEATVLVVEDDEDWRFLLSSYLPESCRVTAVGDYASAVSCVKAGHFDIVVLDLRLVDQDDENFQGMELLALLREREKEENRSAKVIIISAYSTTEHVREGFKSYGLFDYINKHKFDKRDFRDSVSRAISSSFAETR